MKDTIKITIPVVPITILLAILKLTGLINISWFWVFFPVILVYGLLGIFVLGFCAFFGGMLLLAFFSKSLK
jgi:hypothetical protein